MPSTDHPPSPTDNPPQFRPVVVGALYPAVERGLTADTAAAKALGGIGYPVCTVLLMAGHTTVTDATDVPVDTVRAQLEHLGAEVSPNGLKIGVLATHQSAAAVMEYAAVFEGPVILDLQLSGPSGETVLTSRGIDVVMEHLHVPDLLIVHRTDAEPISGGEIHSLDDAQVAAQRLVRRGARAVLIKCGALPSRHFEAAEGSETQGDGAVNSELFNADLFYDGNEFALFEAPELDAGQRTGAASALSLAALQAMVEGKSAEAALQRAKLYATEGLRSSIEHGQPLFDYYWQEHQTR